MGSPLSPDLLRKVDAYWRAANYLSVGQIYLFDNPLLKEPLTLKLIDRRRYVSEHGDDVSAIRDWRWGGTGAGTHKADTAADC